MTGANSFIGSSITEFLIRKKFRVYACYRRKKPVIRNGLESLKKIKFRRLDVSKTRLLNLPRKIDVIIHVAGVSEDKDTTPRQIINCNIVGTHNILQYAKECQAKKIIFTSSLSVYGDVNDKVLDEKTVFRNPDLYGASKIAAEKLIIAESHWLPSIIIRLPGVVGKGAPNRSWMVQTLNSIKKDKKVKIYNQNKYFNNIVEVNHLASFIAKLVRKKIQKSKIILLGSKNKKKIKTIVMKIKTKYKSKSKVLFIKPLKNSFLVDNTAANKIGYHPQSINEILENI